MTDREILEFLNMTGHLEYPHGEKQEKPTGPFGKALKTAEALNSIASFQGFMAEDMERECLKEHGRTVRFYGEIGPATLNVMAIPRCGEPDYGEDVQPAIGSGSWKGCHNIGDFHSAAIYEDERGMPSFLRPHIVEIRKQVQAANDDIGCHFEWVDSPSKANIVVSYVVGRGWIGLAIVGNQQSCGSQIWAKYDVNYRPANILTQHTILHMHEHGHNQGLHHTRTGIMSPVIQQGLVPTWRGDASEPVLVKGYGGVPYNPPSHKDEYLTHDGYKTSKGRVFWVPRAVPLLMEKS